MLKIALIAIAISLAILILLHYFTDFDRKQKLYVFGVLLGLIVLILLYENQKESSQKHRQEKIAHFLQGGELICRGRVLSNREFNYVSGTMSFVSKEKGANSGLIFSIDECEIKQ